MERQPSLKSLTSLSPQDWELLLDDFFFSSSSSSSSSRRTRWLHLPLLDMALSSLLRRDFPAHLKPQLVSFLDDQLPLLSASSTSAAAASPLASLLATLTSLLTSADPIASHLLVATVSCFVAIFPTPPIAVSDAAQLQGLVDVLLVLANKPNHGPDRALRALACDALRELELAFPGLLADAAGHLFVLASAERSHAAQSYVLLLAAVARDLLRLRRLNSSSSVLSTSVPLTPFAVPSHLLSPSPGDSPEPARQPSDLNLREIRRIIAFLMERPQALTPAAAMELSAMLAEIAGAVAEWAPAVAALAKVQFSGLVYASDPLLLHAVLVLWCRFPEAFGADDEKSVARRLALVAREAHQQLPVRLLVLHWLMGSTRLRGALAGLVPRFYPGVFDPLALKAKMLDCLAIIAAGVDGEKGRGGGRGEVVQVIEDGLVCVSSFQWLPPWSTETAVAFRTLHKFLVGVARHNSDGLDRCGVGILMNSTIFNTMQTMLVNLASKHRGLVPVIAIFVDRLLACEEHRHAGEWLLRTLNERLLLKLRPGYQLSSYYPLFEKIAQNETVPPLGLIELLSKQMVALAEKHGPDTELRTWSQGSKVVSICRVMLKHHHSSRVFLPLSRLLVLTTESFPDLEVRDHARICLRMLACIPGKKLRHIMGIGEQPSGVTPSHPVSLFDVPSPCPAQDLKNLPGVASYIHLERVAPLVVKQSWSLAIPNFSIQNKESSSIVSIQDVTSAPPLEPERQLDTSIERITCAQEPLRVMDSRGAEILEILRRHFACIPDYRHMPGIKIRIPCVFRFESKPFSRTWLSDSPASGPEGADELPAIYATTITFSSTAKFGKIPPCRVPFLLGEPSNFGREVVSLDNGDQEESSCRASVVIELEPQEPMPGLVDVMITANTENCQVLSGPLQSVTVGIEDMFLKASVPPDTPKNRVAEYYLDLFHALWEACDSSSRTGRETFPFSGGKGSAAINGTRSVKLLEVTPKVLIRAVERYLAPYVVSVAGDPIVNVIRGNGVIKDIIWEEDDSDAAVGDSGALVPYSPDATLELQCIEDEMGAEIPPHVSKRNIGALHVLIFLPPRFHLLFLMEVGYASTLVRIRTDHWPCLAYVDEYLEALL